MSSIQIEDAESIVLDLHQLPRQGEPINLPLRKINCSDMYWQVQYELFGVNGSHFYHLTVDINLTVQTHYSFKVVANGNTLLVTDDHWLYKNRRTVSYDQLRDHITDDKLILKCIANFQVSTPLVGPSNRIYLSCKHCPTDYKLIVEKQQIDVHRHFLALISPVFHAMLTRETVENRTSKSEIKDLDYATVNTAIDFCYGRPLDLCLKNVIGILRFADKYDIKSVITELQYIPFTSKLTCDNFCLVLHYAVDMSLGALIVKCTEFFKRNHNSITHYTEFQSLPASVILSFLSAAYDKHLEPSIIKDLNVNTFCPTANYAWKYNREKVKPICAAYFNSHKAEITELPEFINLESNIIKDILKAALHLKTSEEKPRPRSEPFSYARYMRRINCESSDDDM